jgi:hypothetical protein
MWPEIVSIIWPGLTYWTQVVTEYQQLGLELILAINWAMLHIDVI